MLAKTFLAGALVAAASAPASAQSWGFGVEVGPPVYYEPYPAPPPGYYGAAPYYGPPPVAVVPTAPLVIQRAASPDAVLDMLEDEGYSELSPMAERGDWYKLSAVNPEGDLVALEISRYTGEIERELIIEANRRIRRAAPPPVIAATPQPLPQYAEPAPVGAPPRAMRDRLRPLPEPSDGEDPLVVY